MDPFFYRLKKAYLYMSSIGKAKPEGFILNLKILPNQYILYAKNIAIEVSSLDFQL